MEREKVLKGKILEYLKEHKQLTSMEAVKLFGTTRLSARIFELREEGYKIPTIMTYGVDPSTNECTSTAHISIRGE